MYDRKTEIAEGRAYYLHQLDSSETPIDAYHHIKRWVAFIKEKQQHKWDDEDLLFPALSNMSKKYLKTEVSIASLPGCEKVGIHWGKKMSGQVFIILLNCISRSLKPHGATVPEYLKSSWSNIWFTSHTFRRAGAQYRFMYAIPAKRWSL